MNIKKNITNMFELPKEIVLDMPLITMVGTDEMCIENYKGIIEYSEEKIRISTSCGVASIEGNKLSIKQITQEKFIIAGMITSFQYLL